MNMGTIAANDGAATAPIITVATVVRGKVFLPEFGRHFFHKLGRENFS